MSNWFFKKRTGGGKDLVLDDVWPLLLYVLLFVLLGLFVLYVRAC